MIVDEIKEFKTGRYIGAMEAYTGIIGRKYFPNYVNKPPVERLDLHLENQNVKLPDLLDEDLIADEDVRELDADRLKETKLTAFFEINKME